MPETFATPDNLGEIRASDLHTSLGESLSAQAGEAFMGGARSLYRLGQYAGAAGDGVTGDNQSMADVENADAIKASIPDVSIDNAKAQIKQAGLESHVALPDQSSIQQPVLNLMIQHGHERADYDAAVSRGPQGFTAGALGLVTSIGAGVIDPVNLAAFSIPIMGEARFGMMLANAGDGLAARAGVRGLVGAGQGAVGSAALAPGDWWLHTRDGQDYTMADALRSVIMGAGMGAVAHAGGGAFSDMRARAAGAPLEGSAEDTLFKGLALKPGEVPTPAPPDAWAGEGVPGIAAGENNAPADSLRDLPPNHPARMLADLPPQAREDVVRASMADMIQDRPVRSAEMLQEAAKEDPRIAETLEAYHGSPHDFDAFSSEQIGTGEGAQAYGHGLYFAEHPTVAESYKDNIDRDIGYKDEADLALSYLHEAKNDRPKAERLYRKNAAKNGEVPDEKVLDYFKEGNLYRVRIAANKDHFLDWDKPLNEQSEHVRNALVNHADPAIAGIAEKWGHDVPNVYRRIGGSLLPDSDFNDTAGRQAAASKALHEAGIPGIKYLDGASRDKGKGTRNFVLFNDKDAEITHKNGVPIARADRGDLTQLPGKSSASKGPQSLLQFIAAHGGVSDKDPQAADLLQSFGGKSPTIRGAGKLVREGGKSLDALREAAVEAGYIHDNGAENGGVTESSIEDLLQAVDREARGEKQYPAGDEGFKTPAERAAAAELDAHQREQFARDTHDALETGLDDREITEIRPQLKRRAMSIMEKSGERDPEAALEQALKEYGMSREGGGDDAAAPPARADWKQFEHPLDSVDDPQAVAESKEAAATPEPASIEPEKAPSAAEAAAKDADQLLADIKSKLSDEEWQSLEESLDKVAGDKEAQEQIVRDGAACLAEAMVA